MADHRRFRRLARPVRSLLLVLAALPLLTGSAAASQRAVLGELFSADG